MAKKNYEELSRQLLELVGGKENVVSLTHCVTRLRFQIKDKGLVKQDSINAISGIMGSQWSGAELQVIIGQTVEEVYDAMLVVGGFERKAAIDENLDEDLTKEKLTLKTVPQAILRTITGCIFPIIPALIPAGLIQLLASILGPNLLNIFASDSDIITLLTFVGNAPYYYMPFLVAWSAAKYFKTSYPVALTMAAVLVHPTLLSLVEEGTAFTVYGIPMQLVSYTNQFLPILLSVWIMSYVYNFIRKYLPVSLRYAFLPLLTLLVMLPIMLCVVGPFGYWVGILIGNIANWLANTAGPIAIGLIGGLWYFLVALGMDKALSPVITQTFAQYGYDNLFWCSAVFGTYALLGVGIASFLRAKGDKRATTASNAITLGLGGISEPIIYTSVLTNKANMAALFLGGFCGGVIGGFFQCKAWTFGTGNALFALVFAGGDGSGLVPGVVGSVVAFCVAFAISFVGLKYVKDTNEGGAGGPELEEL